MLSRQQQTTCLFVFFSPVVKAQLSHGSGWQSKPWGTPASHMSSWISPPPAAQPNSADRTPRSFPSPDAYTSTVRAANTHHVASSSPFLLLNKARIRLTSTVYWTWVWISRGNHLGWCVRESSRNLLSQKRVCVPLEVLSHSSHSWHSSLSDFAGAWLPFPCLIEMQIEYSVWSIHFYFWITCQQDGWYRPFTPSLPGSLVHHRAWIKAHVFDTAALK